MHQKKKKIRKKRKIPDFKLLKTKKRNGQDRKSQDNRNSQGRKNLQTREKGQKAGHGILKRNTLPEKALALKNSLKLRLFQRKSPLRVSNMKMITFSGAGNATCHL